MTCTAAMNGAASVTYKQASEMNTPISEMALYSGLRWATIEMAQPTAIPANKMKRTANMLCLSLCPLWLRMPSPQRTQRNTKSSSPAGAGLQKLREQIKQARPLNGGGDDDVDNRERHQELP